jgi:two-component system, cell cycle sensor histidine kinase and response regulator CckA
MGELSKTERRRRWLWALAATLLVGLVAEVVVIGSFGTEQTPFVFLPHATFGVVLAGLMVLVLLFVVYASQSLRALAAEEVTNQRLAMREVVIHERLAGVSELLDTMGMLAQKRDLRGTISLAVDRALPCFEADHASVLLFIPGTGQLEPLVSVGGGSESRVAQPPRPGEGLVGGVHATGEPLTLNTPQACASLADELGLESAPCSALCVPICFDGTPLGVFCVARMTLDEPFAPMHARALQVLAAQCGTAIFRSLHDRRIHTEREEAKEALLDTEKRYRQFFEHSIAGAYISDPDGRLVDCNLAFARILGLPSVDEVIASDVAAHYLAGGARRAFLDRLREQRSVDRRVDVLHRSDGGPVHVIETAIGVFGPQNELLEIHGYVIDDTERLRANEHLQLAQRMEAFGRLTGGIAHSFNNMLTVIMGSAQMIQAWVPADHPARPKAVSIQQAAARATAMMRQLLAFSRQQALQPKLLDLGTVLAEMEDMLRQVLGASIEIVTTPGASLDRVKADPGQLQQVLLNLALNARDAMPGGGMLTIETANVELDDVFAAGLEWDIEPGPYVLLAMSDTGCGMDEQTQARAFEPFFTTKTIGKATGLGLSAVYGIVKQSGGHVLIHSEPGQGATVRIYLPSVEEVHVTVEEDRPLPGRGGETVLVVEDEELVRAVIVEVLASGGYTVLEAKSAGEAVVLATTHDGPIDLLVTDLVMPGKSGHELVARLTSLLPDLAVLRISGYVDPAVVSNGGSGPETAFLQKPFTPEVLLRKVRETLDEPRRKAA